MKPGHSSFPVKSISDWLGGVHLFDTIPGEIWVNIYVPQIGNEQQIKLHVPLKSTLMKQWTSLWLMEKQK